MKEMNASANILIVEKTSGASGKLSEALRDAGWNVDVTLRLGDKSSEKTAPDAVILIATSGQLASALRDLQQVCAGTPILLATELDRSGWDRTFSAPEALAVDALFDLPVKTNALIKRLRGILQARKQPRLNIHGTALLNIIQWAITNEEASEAFYRRAASSVTRPETRETLETLAREEGEHKQVLERFMTGAAPLPAGLAQALSLTESLGTPEITPDIVPADAFLLAIRKEKLSITFYENWASLYPEGDERKLLLQLADVERRHKAHVEAMFTNAAFPEVWE